MSAQCCPLSSCDDPSEMYSSAIRKAKKEHRCSECDEVILSGTLYEIATGKLEDSWFSERTCLSCVEIRDHFACDGFIHGSLWSDLENNFFPDMKAGGPCMEGLSPEAKQRLFDRRTDWYFSQ